MTPVNIMIHEEVFLNLEFYVNQGIADPVNIVLLHSYSAILAGANIEGIWD